MRHYETLFIISPDLAEEETQTIAEKYSALLTDHGSVMAKVEHWGRKRLAYTVKKFHKGYYVLFEYGAEPGAVMELERLFKIDEDVIRFLTVKKEDTFDPESVVKEQEEAKEEAQETEAAQAEEDAPAAAEEKPEEEEPEEPAEEEKPAEKPVEE
jgi:small subunit ribosomal protein S6